MAMPPILVNVVGRSLVFSDDAHVLLPDAVNVWDSEVAGALGRRRWNLTVPGRRSTYSRGVQLDPGTTLRAATDAVEYLGRCVRQEGEAP
jgi:hypothetical protein